MCVPTLVTIESGRVCLLLQLFIYMVGAKVGFFRGDVKELVSDIQALRPTVFVSVPRLLNRVYDKVCGRWVWSRHNLTPSTPTYMSGDCWSVSISSKKVVI